MMFAVDVPEWLYEPETGVAGWIVALAILLIGLVVARILRSALASALSSRLDAVVADLVSRLVAYVVFAMTAVYALEAVGVAVGPILGALGIVGIAVAFALQDILENFVAGLMLQVRRPFVYGDEIHTGDTEGLVVAVDSRSVTVHTPDGETVEIPSSLVIKEPLTNHTTRGARRTSLDVGVAYGTDLDRAVEVITAEVRACPEVNDDPPAQTFISGFGDSSIDLHIMFWHGPTIQDRWRARTAVSLAVDRATRTNGIQIPFPQRVLHRPDPVE